MRLAFSPEAERDAEAIDDWWRANRLDAPRLFREELAAVCEAIQHKPLILRRYAEKRGKAIYRWLLPRTRQHLYYLVESQNDLIIILRVWGARRRRGPKL